MPQVGHLDHVAALTAPNPLGDPLADAIRDSATVTPWTPLDRPRVQGTPGAATAQSGTDADHVFEHVFDALTGHRDQPEPRDDFWNGPFASDGPDENEVSAAPTLAAFDLLRCRATAPFETGGERPDSPAATADHQPPAPQPAPDPEPPVALLYHEGGRCGGADQPVAIPHDPLQSTVQGTWAMCFTAFTSGNAQNQTLFSKDGLGSAAEGHLCAYIRGDGMLVLRFQAEDGDVFTCPTGAMIAPGMRYHLAVAVTGRGIDLFLNGDAVAIEPDLPAPRAIDGGELLLGASRRAREGRNGTLQWHFSGDIAKVLLLDRAISQPEAQALSEAGGDIDGIDALYDIGTEDGPAGPATTASPSRRVALARPLRMPRRRAPTRPVDLPPADDAALSGGLLARLTGAFRRPTPSGGADHLGLTGG
jgi:hypothetical protein